MPELPEVETIRQYLISNLLLSSVSKISIPSSRLLLQDFHSSIIASTQDFSNHLVRQTLMNIIRKGKYLIFIFSSYSIIIHLGMSGRLLLFLSTKQVKDFSNVKNPISKQSVFSSLPFVEKHIYLTISFSNSLTLLFQDPRTFGKIILLDHLQFKQHPRIKKLAPEPFKTYQSLKAKWPLTSKKVIKSLLLDQTFIAGIGNIYADEALFLSKIHPLKVANLLTYEEWTSLLKNLHKILNKSVKLLGTTFSDYIQPNGKKGSFSQQLNVYGKNKSPCFICKSIIQKVKIQNRSSHFCSTCQPL